jgi:choline-sulfatase
MRTYHSGAKDMAPVMLFDIEADPHLINDLTDARPEVVNEGLALLERWTTEMMATSEQAVDPLWTVMSEGGPFHTRDEWQPYVERLRKAGRNDAADWLEATNGGYRVGLDGAP